MQPEIMPYGNPVAAGARDTARLRRVLVPAVGILLAAASGLLGIESTRTLHREGIDALVHRGVLLARLVAAAGGGADPSSVERLCAAVAAGGEAVFAEVLQADGSVLASGGPADLRPDPGIDAAPASAASPAPARLRRGFSAYGEPLYLFTHPLGESRARPRAPAPGGASPFGPRPAVAAPRPRAVAAPAGVVRIALPAAGLDRAGRAHATRALLVSILVGLAGMLVTHVAVRRLAGPPAGDARRFEDSATLVCRSVDAVAAGTADQQEALRGLGDAARALSASVREVTAHAGGLASATEQTSASLAGVTASVDEVAELADGLTLSVNDTAATTEEVVASIKEIDRNVALLERFVVETSEAMARMENVLQQIEANAAESKGISELVAQNAEKGMRAVTLTIDGMEGIRGSVLESARIIESVGRRSQEIGLILSVIQEVTEQTNLLALNAAIIAAQAGENGRGFAVVADEIRQLAERTAASAKEIGTLIGTFQSESGQAVAAMQDGSRRVLEGSDRSREAGRALQEILESARRSSTMVSEIAAATREQARGSREVSASVDKVHDMVGRIKTSTAGQTLGSEQIMSAVENMREMSGHVKRATVDQGKGSRQITQAVGQVAGMVGAIRRASAAQAENADRIVEALQAFAALAAANQAAARAAQQALAALASRGRALRP